MRLPYQISKGNRTRFPAFERKSVLTVYLTPCHAALSFEHEDDKRTCFKGKHKGLGSRWPRRNLTSRGTAATTMSRSPELHFAAPSATPVFSLWQSSFPGWRDSSRYLSVPHSGWGHKACCLLRAEDTLLPGHWLSRFWTPAPFLLQSKQQLYFTCRNPIQHQAGCSYSQEAPAFQKKLGHSLLCWFSTSSHAKSWGGALKEISG